MRDANKLRVTEVALDVAELTYLVTRRFPADERSGLSLQMRRAAVSIGSNIAEGCGRFSERQFLSYLSIAMGSASELEFQSRLVARLRYVPDSQLMTLREQLTVSRRMLVKLAANVQSRLER